MIWYNMIQYYNKTTIVWWSVWGDHWVCGAPTTIKVISTYSTSDEGGFIFISSKRKAYDWPEPQGMLYCIYYELNQCPPPVFSPTLFQPSTVHGVCIDKKIRMLAMTYLSSICSKYIWHWPPNTFIFEFTIYVCDHMLIYVHFQVN